MSKFYCYETLIKTEHKRFMTAISDAQPELMDEISALEEKIELPKITIAFNTATLLADRIWSEYLYTFGDLLESCTVAGPAPLKIVDKPRTQFSQYVSSLRAMANNTHQSYWLKMILSHYGLSNLAAKISEGLGRSLVFFRQAEAVADWMQLYMTWLEVGASEAYRYFQGQTTADCMPDISDFYQDVRVQAYATLKTVELEPAKLEKFLDDLSSLIDSAINLVTVKEEIYSSLENEDFEKLFHALVSKKEQSPDYDGTKFENVHEINEYIRQHVQHSCQAVDGHKHNVIMLLRTAKDNYMSELTTEIVDLLAFIPLRKDQELFVRRFEEGKIWQGAE